MKKYNRIAALIISSMLMVGLIQASEIKKSNQQVSRKSENFPKAGLILWISADRVKNVDNQVTILYDQSGKKNHAQHDLGDGILMTNPIVAKEMNSGQSVLSFSGENCCFSFKQIDDVRTVFCVISKDPKAFGTLNEKCVLGGKDSHDLHAGWTNDVIFNTVVNSGHLSQFVADGKQWLNGQPIQAQKTPWPKQLGLLSFTTSGPIRVDQIARDRNFADRSWQGDIAEILLFNTVLSDKDRSAVQQYLLTKYAIKPEFLSSDNIIQKEKTNPKDSAPMVLVPAGEFLMGSKEEYLRQGEYPQRTITLDDYYIYKYEVTVAQYKKFCAETSRAMPPEPSWKWQDNHPIVNVTWADASAYAVWAGAALPTEAQWEKAARGTDGRTYVWGESFTKTTCHTSDGKTAPVGSYPTGISPYGALDMAGNVWEWCSDWYDPDYYATAPNKNPLGPTIGTTRVLRGGSWGFNVSEFFRVTYRNRCLPGCRYGDYGFRCVFPASKKVATANKSLQKLPATTPTQLYDVVASQETPVAMQASDWPQLDGPAVNCISPETNINTDWTAHKPPVLWAFAMHDLGGYAGAIIAKGIVYIIDRVGSNDILRALDLITGTQLWESGYKDSGDATAGCPVYSDGKIYTFSHSGNANCFEAATGKILWSRNLQQEYDGHKADWGYSASPAVDGKKVIYLPGGANASIVALDKETGVTLWQSGSDPAGHATPILATIHNIKQYIIFNTYGAIGVRADDGTQLWRHQWTTQHNCNAIAPIVMGNKVFISSGYGVGCAMLDIGENWKVTEIWKNKELIARTARPILYKGYLYDTDETARLVCLNPRTGMMVWAREGFGAPLDIAWKDGFSCGSGGLILVDGTLLVVSELTKSIVAVKATPDGYQELGRFELLVNGNNLFSPLAFSNGKLVVRDKKKLYCIDLKSSSTTVAPKMSIPTGPLGKNLPSKVPVASPTSKTGIEAQPGAESGQTQFQVNWPQFRGPDGSGFSPLATAPKAWDESAKAGILWKAPITLPGFNSPIVWGQRVFISGANNNTREVYSYNTSDGKLMWTCPILNVETGSSQIPDISEFAGYAASTMATDGQRVYVIFPNGDLAGVNFDGKQVWSRNLGLPQNNYGHAASLAVWQNKLIVQWDLGSAIGNSRLLLIEGATGKTVWEKTRPVPCSWASPIVVEAEGKTQIITAAFPWLAAYAVTDGAEIWKAKVLEGEITPSPILVDNRVYVASPDNKLIALRPDGQGDVTETHVLWSSEENVPNVTSPTSNGKLVFCVTSYGMGTCLDAKTGKVIWQHDFGKEIQASPAIAGNLVYVASTDGHSWVFEAGSEYKEIGKGVLDDKFYASPAFAGGCLFLRGNKSLYCISE